MIKTLKKDGLIYKNYEEKIVAEDGSVIENIQADLVEFKSIAIDTINWEVGENIKKALGDQQTLLSASNSKAITLLMKVVDSLNPDTRGLTTLEKSAYDSIKNLATNGYADSELLNKSLSNIDGELKKATDKIQRVSTATTNEEIVSILNEV